MLTLYDYDVMRTLSLFGYYTGLRLEVYDEL